MNKLLSSLVDALLERLWAWVIGAVIIVASPFIYSVLAEPTWVWFASGSLAAFGWTFLIMVLALRKKRVLVIHSTLYGIGENKYQDVTDCLRGYIKKNQLNVPVTNQTFLCDPYPGVRKYVKVSYSYSKLTPQEVIRHENDQLVLPDED